MRVSLLLAAVICQGFCSLSTADDSPPRAKLPQRHPWTTSRITGFPDPPPPYRTEQVYPKLSFEQPVEVIPYPDSKRFVVVEQKGRVLLVEDRPDVSETELMLDGANDIPELTIIYGLAFHPRFSENRLCYLCYITRREQPDGTHVSQFRVTEENPPRIDPASEKLLITWKSGGHNGGSLKFGNDGYLYITTGDGSPPDPPDGLSTGQDLSDLLSSLLRIDVDHQQPGRPYAIPDDNPFLDLPDARPEIYAYGFRNPWRMSIDRATGDIWLGDVGWQLWEMVYRVERGGNYGWSVMEGPQPVRTTLPPGPTPILPPMKAHDRADAASITGGFVYHGKRLAELQGAYIYGDYVTGKIWALRNSGSQLTSLQELTDSPLAIVCFYQAPDGELAIVDYNTGTFHRLVPNPASGTYDPRQFPRKLSDTGLFSSVADQTPAPGVIPFSINAPQWMDHAQARRYLAVPGNGSMTLVRPRKSFPTGNSFPKDSVLVKTISLEMERGNPTSRRLIETQILHFSGESWRGNAGEWYGYTYVWNEDQTDAQLAPAEGTTLTFSIQDKNAPGGVVEQSWRIHSRTECYTCHNPWAGYRLAFTEEQLDRPQHYGDLLAHQIEALTEMGVVTFADRLAEQQQQRLSAEQKKQNPPEKIPSLKPLVDPRDKTASLEDRARSYLHANCAHCHRYGGGGTSIILLDRQAELNKCRLVGESPTRGSFKISRGALLKPGDPFGSVLHYRLAKTGTGHMPHLGSQLVDWDNLRMIHEWIESIPCEQDPAADIRELARQTADAILSGKTRETAPQRTLVQLLSDSRVAQQVQWALATAPHSLSKKRRNEILQIAGTHPDPIIRDLFEQFLPQSQRIQRLGSSVRAEEILALTGNAERGKALFLKAESIQCRNCHRIGNQGQAIGPDLTRIAKDRTKEQLLQSILEPSKTIDPKYRTYVIETESGRVHTGLLKERTDDKTVLLTADNKTIEISAEEIEQMVSHPRSLMPDLLFRDMTAEQLADILAFLSSLK